LKVTVSLKTNIREAWRIALPYFRSEERYTACGLLACVVSGQLALVAMAVAENYWRNAFFQTLQEKSWSGFVDQFLVYVAIGVGFVLATVYQRYFTQWLTIRWRHWLTARYLDRWLDGPVHYRAMIVPGRIDNPDQRIAEDVRQFIDTTLSLTVGLLGEIARLFSFVAVLWTLSDLIPVHLFGQSYVIPGYLVWAALIYAVLGTAMTHWIGRSLIPLDFEQERREADFRFALVRLRENAEAVALLRGETSEKQELLTRFRAIMQNWFRLMARQQWVGLFTGAYRRFSLYFPYFAMAPLYFGGNMQFGAFMQSGSAFNQVRDAFSYFISSYLKIAELSAVIQRLSQFGAAIESARTDLQPHPQAPVSGSSPITACHLIVSAPDGTSIVRLDQLAIARGEAVLITGASGIGKTSLFRAFGGIWPFTTGDVHIDDLACLMLPQRAYIPLGSLGRALAYPCEVTSASDAEYRDALTAVGLEVLAGDLSTVGRWDKRLSEGEKQRLSIARALLFRPAVLFLDEATAALDEDSELALHQLIRERLSSATILAISHREKLTAIYDRTIRIVPLHSS
jgi:putative ATP-binding cassette transporter